MKNPKLIYSLAGVVLLFGFIEFFSFSSNTNSEKTHREQFSEDYKIFSLDIPEDLSFANEEIPLHDFDVREKVDKELLVNTYWQSQSILFIKRSKRWFSIIEPILKKNGIPDDFKYLALIESGLTNIVSPAGATGFWQIMKGTGKEYGLEINKEVDERYHVVKSTEFACEYLKKAYKKFNSWTLAAASYNMGMHGLAKQMKRQKSNSYYNLLLNAETGRYVYRIIAVKEILSHPDKYGFNVREQDKYNAIKTKNLQIDSTIANFADFAIKNGITYKSLKLFNPWLRQNHLTNKAGNVYTLLIPNDTTQVTTLRRELIPDSLVAQEDSTSSVKTGISNSESSN